MEACVGATLFLIKNAKWELEIYEDVINQKRDSAFWEINFHLHFAGHSRQVADTYNYKFRFL